MESIKTVDLLVIGGGVNGAGIARDASGRGLSVLLCEKDDLAQGTSSRSGKLIHGGLRYLEYYEFRLVREALAEREVLLEIAPHLVFPMRFVLPHSPEQRPVWLIRLGLFLYDHLGGRKRLSATRYLNLTTALEGQGMQTRFTQAFEYSDCGVDDARLVVLNALDAKEHGAEVLTRTKFVSAEQENDVWKGTLHDQKSNQELKVHAKTIVNTAGPWIDQILSSIKGASSKYQIRLVKGSHIVVKKFWQGTHAYLLQNTDKRVIFVIPYQNDLCVIGTTDIPFEGNADDVAIDQTEINYLFGVVNRYFQHQLTDQDIIHTYAGVRPLFDDNAGNPSAVTRDYQIEINQQGKAVLLSLFGGKITAYREIAETVVERLKPFFPHIKDAWTSKQALPGGNIADADFDTFLQTVRQRYQWLGDRLSYHLVRSYGTRAFILLDDAQSLADLGEYFGGEFYEKEARYLLKYEWATAVEDILERRTKHGLFLNAEQKQHFAKWLNSTLFNAGLGSRQMNQSKLKKTVKKITPSQLERRLQSVGKKVFVECFDIFQKYANERITEKEAIVEIQKIFPDKQESGCEICLNHTKSIFQSEMEYSALEEIVHHSPRIEDEIKEKAETLLQMPLSFR